MPLREQRDSPDVEAAFARLRDLVDASGRTHHAIANEAGLNRSHMSKLLEPAQYTARRDWSDVQKILAAAGADIDDYAHAHGHLWALDPSPEPATPTPTPTPTPTLAPTGSDIEWPGQDEPTMPVSNPPAPRNGSQPTTHQIVTGPGAAPRVPVQASPRVPVAAGPRLPASVPVSVPPQAPSELPSWVPSRVSPRVPPRVPLPLPASSTFVPRVPRRRLRRAARRGTVTVLAVVLVAGAGVAALRGWGSPEPPPGAVTAQQAPGTVPELPVAAPVAPATLPELLRRPEVVNTVAVGPIAGFTALSPDGRTAYVAHRARGVITEIDTATDQVRTSYPVPAGPPQSLVVSPDGSRLYVSVYGRTAPTGPSAVAVLDARTRQQTVAIPFATRPFVSALTPDGRALWVPDHDTGTISVVDLTTNTIAREFGVSPNPHWIAFSDDGARAYAANHESNVIDVIDTATYARLTTIPVGTSPHSIALQPRGPLLAVAAYDTDGVDLVDTTTATRVATVPVGRNPNVVRWSPDGRLLYATVETEGRVAVIDPTARRVVGEVPVGQTPSSIALTPDGTRAYVTNLDDGTVSVLRTTRQGR